MAINTISKVTNLVKKPRKYTFVPCSLLLAMLALPLFANGPKYVFRKFGIKEGMSQEICLTSLQDREGFLWVGTQSGLNRFDGYNFEQYRSSAQQAGSISANEVQCSFEDSKGRLWFGTQSGGLNLYNPDQNNFRSWRHDNKDENSLSFNAVQRILEDEDGSLWIPTWGGGLNHFNPEQNTFTHFRHVDGDPNSLAADIIWDMIPGGANSWWIATDRGLCHFDSKTKRFKTYLPPGELGEQAFSKTRSLYQAADGLVWVGTGTGLHLFDAHSEQFTRFQASADPSGETVNASIKCIFQDSKGTVWLGGTSGLSRYEPATGQFRHFASDTGDPASLPNTAIYDICEDRHGNLWLSTVAGLFTFKLDQEIFGFYQREQDGHYLIYETLYSMAAKGNRYLWMATSLGLVRFDRQLEQFTHWSPGGEDAEVPVHCVRLDQQGLVWLTTHEELMTFSEDAGFVSKLKWGETLSDFELDPNGKDIWLSTYQGLLRFDRKTAQKQLFSHDPEDENSLSHNATIGNFKDSRGNLWVGTYGGGLNCLKAGSSQFTHYVQDPNLPNGIANNAINLIVEGPDGTIWVGTRDGLSRWNPETEQWRNYWREDGLPDTFINGVLFSGSNEVWVSTDFGLAVLNTLHDSFTYFDSDDGLQGNTFSAGAFASFEDGTMAFGNDGFNLFNPKNIKTKTPQAPVVLTELLIFNEPVKLSNANATSPLTRPLRYLDRLEMSYRDYVLAFRFAALDFSFSSRRTYEFMLEGLDKNWIPALNETRLANYTNLSGGTYTLHVRARDKNGKLFQERALVLKINPPPWRTPWAYVLYILLILAGIYSYVNWQRQKLEKEREIVRRLNEVDRLKDAFLANTSHELRTPLHGMIGLAEAVLDHYGDKLDEVGNQNLEMIVSSGMRLSNLINDILDFSKLEHNSLQCTIQPVDLFGTVRVVLGLTSPLLVDKELVMENGVSSDLPPVLADENRLQQILFNLVGNAVKFTEKGTITVTACVEGEMIAVSISDTGIGIEKDKCEAIFQAFQQADGSTARLYSGTGLGLTVTRKLVELQQGKISVRSKLGEGSTFTFTLPSAGEGVMASPTEPGALRPRSMPNKLVQGISSGGTMTGFRILVVDDDPVNRMVLINHLSRDYQVVAVESGMAAIQAVEEHQGFDLILLDVMMPKMTGFDVCRHLRNTFPSSELPVIYLTAKMNESDVVTGFETGANDYIIKPVSKGELLMRVETHLSLLDSHRNLEAKVVDRTQHLVSTQKELLRQAHSAGMAEIAVDVMHNVGNRLNSLGTSVQLMEDLATRDRKGVALLERFTEMVLEHRDDLQSFLANDPTVARLPDFLPKITQKMVANQEAMVTESRKLMAHLKAMAATIQDQQKHSGLVGLVSKENINELLESVLQMGAVTVQENHGCLKLDLAPELEVISINRVRLTRVLICLFQNAMEAIAKNGEDKAGVIKLKTDMEQGKIILVIEDNGEGINEENMVRIYAHGFSTRQGKQGFGLHYCANTLREMGAEIEVQSKGEGLGTRVILRLPLNPPS